MLVVLTAAFLLRRFAPRAIPLPAATYAGLETPTVPDDDPSKPYHGWDIFDSLWICMFTAAACTWMAVHPNVPAKKRGWWTFFGRSSRAFLMFLPIFEPESMIVWAFIQWRGAVMIRDAVNKAIKEASPNAGTDKKTITLCNIDQALEKPVGWPWSTRQGHFLQMGGLHLIATQHEIDLCEGVSPEPRNPPIDSQTAVSTNRTTEVVFDQSPYWHEISEGSWSGNYVPVDKRADDIWEGVLTVGILKRLIAERLIAFPVITEDEISNRSEDDALHHIITALLLACFIVPIIGRAAHGVAITELELITAFVVGLDSVMYILWWSKPYDVRRPVVFRTRRVEELSAKGTVDTTSSSLDQEFDVEKHVPTTIASSIEGRVEDGRGTGPNISNENSAGTNAESALFSNV